MSLHFWDEFDEDYIREFYGVKLLTRKGENMDKKFWMICGLGGKYDTYEAAEKAAKQRVNQTHSDAVIMEAVAVATFPLADITVNKLTETTASK